MCLTGAIAGQLILKETLKPKEKSEDGVPSAPPMTTWEVLRAPGVGMVLYIFGHIMLLALAYTAVSPVCQVRHASLTPIPSLPRFAHI